MGLILTIGGQVFITGGFFCLTALFYKETADKYAPQRQDFFEDLETPVIADFEQDSYDRQQRRKLGSIVSFMGSGMLAMIFIPNPTSGKVIFFACASVLILIGYILKRSASAGDSTNPIAAE